jgi:hypothetical protein
VLAIDGTSGSAVKSFGTNGVQTIGDSLASTTVASAKVSSFESVVPLGLAVSGSTLYVVGRCQFTSPGIGHKGKIAGGMNGKAFIAALDVKSGSGATRFGRDGLFFVDGHAAEVADAVLSGGSLFVTGRWKQRSSDNAFLASIDAATGALTQRFGIGGIKVVAPWEWQSAWSIRVNEHIVYVAGGYLDKGTGGVFVVAFDRRTGLPVTAFGNRGTLLVEGLKFGNQGRIETFGDDLYLIARAIKGEEREIKIGSTTLRNGDFGGFLFHFLKDGTLTK